MVWQAKKPAFIRLAVEWVGERVGGWVGLEWVGGWVGE